MQSKVLPSRLQQILELGVQEGKDPIRMLMNGLSHISNKARMIQYQTPTWKNTLLHILCAHDVNSCAGELILAVEDLIVSATDNKHNFVVKYIDDNVNIVNNDNVYKESTLALSSGNDG